MNWLAILSATVLVAAAVMGTLATDGRLQTVSIVLALVGIGLALLVVADKIDLLARIKDKR